VLPKLPNCRKHQKEDKKGAIMENKHQFSPKEIISDFAKRNNLADVTVTLREGNISGYGKDGKEYVISVTKNDNKFIADWWIGDYGGLQATLTAFESDTSTLEEYIGEYRRQEFISDTLYGLCEKHNVDKKLLHYYAQDDSDDVAVYIGHKIFNKGNTEEFVKIHFELGRGTEKQDYSKFNDDIDRIFSQFSADNMALKYAVLNDLAKQYDSEGFTVEGYMNLMQQYGSEMSVSYYVNAVKRYEDNSLATYNNAQKSLGSVEKYGVGCIDFSPVAIKAVVIEAAERIIENRKTNANLLDESLFWQPPKSAILNAVSKTHESVKKMYGDDYSFSTTDKWSVDEIKTFLKNQELPSEGFEDVEPVFDLQAGDYFIRVSLKNEIDYGYGVTLDYEIRKTDLDTRDVGSFDINTPNIELEMFRLLDDYMKERLNEYLSEEKANEKPQSFLDFLRSEGEYGDNFFDGDVIVGGAEMNHALVWDIGADITPYCYEKYAELLDSPCKVHDHGNGYSVIEVFCDNHELGDEFFAAAAGYIADSEYQKMFVEVDYERIYKPQAVGESQQINQNKNNTEETEMEQNQNNSKITARVTPIEDGSSLKGSATVEIGGMAVHGVKVVEGEKGLFVSMPSNKSKNGNFYDIAFPKSKAKLDNITSVTLEAYQDALKNGRQEKGDPSLDPAKIKVSNFRENPYNNNIMGDCQITVDNDFVVTGVKVIATKRDGELSIALPSKQDENGGYIPVVNATSPESFAQIKTAVIDYYQNQPKTLGNSSYGQLANKKEGEEVLHKTYNSKFAEKIGEQLNTDGVKWSGKIEENNKTVIAVNIKDAEKLDNAVEKAKPPQETKNVKADKSAKSDVPLPETPRSPKKK
jgi:stage V sporulation protein G